MDQEPTIPQEPRQPSQPFDQPQPRPIQPLWPQQPPPQPPRRGRGRLIAIIILVLVAIGLPAWAYSASADGQRLIYNLTHAATPLPTLTPTFPPLEPTVTPTDTATPRPTATLGPPTPTATHSPWLTVQTFHGNGDQNTETFTVPNQWRIAWSCDPSSFDNLPYVVGVAIHKPNGDLLDVPLDTTCKDGNTDGTTSVHVGGMIYLEITSNADWQIMVQIPN